MLLKNPAVGVKLPRKHAVKPPVLLPLMEIRRVLQVVPEPTRSLLMLIVFASMRIGEVLALRWKDCLPDRIVVDERVYDDEFDDVKTDGGRARSAVRSPRRHPRCDSDDVGTEQEVP